MTQISFAPARRPATIPLATVAPWLLFVPLFLLAIYMVGVDEGATSLVPGMYVHEFFHDIRHLLSYPCH